MQQSVAKRSKAYQSVGKVVHAAGIRLLQYGFTWLSDASKQLQMAPDGHTCLQMVPDGSRWLEMAPDGSSGALLGGDG